MNYTVTGVFKESMELQDFPFADSLNTKRSNMSCGPANLDIISDHLEKIGSLLVRIEENTHHTDVVKHIHRESVYKSGQPVIVGIRTNIIKIGDIDGVKQEFKARVYIGAKWREPAMAGRKQDEVRWEEIWQPRIVFFNCATMDDMKKTFILKYDEGDDVPHVQINYTITGVFKEKMELQNFPFEVQELSIILLSDWPGKEVAFEKNEEIKDSVRIDSFDASQSWNLTDMVNSRPEEDLKTEAGAHNLYPKYKMSVYVVRKPGYYMWNVLLIMGIIMILTFSSLAVDPGEPADRLGVTLTLLLTSVAFKFVVSQNLPEISYVTALDIYVLFCMMFQCLMVVQNSVASVFSLNATARRFDWICAIVMVIIIVLFHVFWLLHVGLKIKRRNAIIRKHKYNYAELCAKIDKAYHQKKILKMLK